jgi:hypothetical protein
MISYRPIPFLALRDRHATDAIGSLRPSPSGRRRGAWPSYTKADFCPNATGGDPCVADRVRCVGYSDCRLTRSSTWSVSLVERQSRMRLLGKLKHQISRQVSDRSFQLMVGVLRE